VNLREFRRILRQALFVPVILLLALAVFFLVQLARFSGALRALDHSDRITSQIVDLQMLILDQETGMRGYELTNDPVMLAPYTAGMVPIQRSFASLHKMLAGNDAQEQRLAVLNDRYQIWLGRARQVIAKDSSLARIPRLHQQNKQMMDGIRDVVHEMLQAEDARRQLLSAQAPDLEHRDFISTLAFSMLVGLAVALFTRQRLHTVSRSYNAALEDLKHRSREVRASLQWFQTTLESIGDAVIACDNHGHVQFLNAVATGLTGWTAQDAVGRPLGEVFHIVHEETRKLVENPVEKVRRKKKVVGLANHTALISRQGKEYVIDDSAAPILDEKGEMAGIVLVFHDVTEQRRTEAALISAEKLAVAGRLAATIAHEIHNPLDSVANLLFLLRGEHDPARRNEYLRTAEQELGRTMQISRTMLSLYREPKAPIQIDLKELIEGVLLLLERRIAQQQIQVKSEIAESCIVEGFPAELRQVVTNILVNAIEAAGPNGRMRIRLEGAPAEEFRGVGAMIEVADSGPGITDTAAPRLFQPFFTTKGEHGTGLGLWVCMGIVQKHGGMIRLVNCNDDGYRGACARIYLPAKTMASAERRNMVRMRA
jgi:PAS domain S-box-containing protein